MGYRLSGKVVFVLHLMALALISAAFTNIGGSGWLPPVLWLIAAWLQWMLTTPGAMRDIVGGRRMRLHRNVEQNGWEHWGHARRRDWDRKGRQSRIFLHIGCFAIALFFFAQDHGTRWGAALLATAFSLGVEIGFRAFMTGDASQWRRYTRRSS
ncbi:hypothetical protein [Lysobacter sp. FW306-1B-D06B]|uniref:hypothetical protein n=1 Tax=Lysobacter sp. FW306-1B-D06B TaxID=3140250 RepID=UPI0031407390